MRKTCPDCDGALVPIQLFGGLQGSGLGYASGDVRPGALAGWDFEGVVHAARCAQCNRVLFYAFPEREVARTATATDAFAEAERGLHEARLAERAARSGGPRPPTRATDTELIDLFRSPESHASVRASALAKLVETAPPSTWLPVLQREADELPEDSNVLAVAVELLCQSADPGSVRVLGSLGSRVRWTERLKIVDALARSRDAVAGDALADVLDGALRDKLPSVALAALRALTPLGPSERTHELLLAALEQYDDPLVCAALEALGELGTLDAVFDMQAATRGLFRPRQVKQAAEQGLQRLRERLALAPDGALAVSESAGGGLSEPSPSGALSKLEDDVAPGASGPGPTPPAAPLPTPSGPGAPPVPTEGQ